MDIVVRMTSLGPRALEHASTWPPQDILVYRIPLMVLTELLKMARQSMDYCHVEPLKMSHPAVKKSPSRYRSICFGQ
ncbi:uncharacterized protein LOC141529307 isoform X3 [Cotesia typhae]|uniref:uncharacterized protein LOC141529307 isoform X3 n=1 Tax=Cotesia typhae TaxID=2053667 RepID=UPI003D681BC2